MGCRGLSFQCYCSILSACFLCCLLTTFGRYCHIYNQLSHLFSIMTAPTFSLALVTMPMLMTLWLSGGLGLYSKILQTRIDSMQLAKLI